MSIREIKRRRVVREREMHCDGPSHEGETFMQPDTITVEHGYGSPLDGTTHHFCSLKCLCDWVKEVGSKHLEARGPRYDLDGLLAGMTPENVHPEISTGPSVGNEV